MGRIVSLVPDDLDLTILYEPAEEGWISATIPQIPGVYSQGRTRAKLART